MQLTLVQIGKLSLHDVIAAARLAQPGEIYSVIPAVKDNRSVYLAKVATTGGTGVEFAIDAQSGAVVK